MRNESDYALYRGDKFIDLGKPSELAKRIGVSKKTIIFWASKTNWKRIKNYDVHMISIRIEDDDE